MTWNNKEIARQYVNSINVPGEIREAKIWYHDPFFMNLVRENFSDSTRTVVDVGCGNGYLTKDMIETSPTVRETIGVDLPTMEDHFRRTFRDSEHNVHYLSGEYLDIPLKDSIAQSVICSLMYHWIPASQRATEEISRVLEANGVAIVSYIHPATFHSGKWELDETGTYLYRLHEDVTKPGKHVVYINKTVGPITYYRHPIDAVKNEFFNAGFSSVTIHEPHYSPMSGDDPDLKKYHHHPLYVFIVAKKDAR